MSCKLSVALPFGNSFPSANALAKKRLEKRRKTNTIAANHRPALSLVVVHETQDILAAVSSSLSLSLSLSSYTQMEKTW